MAERRKFSPQFRAEAVQMVIETGKPIAEVAGDLGINEGTLGNWVNAWRHAHPDRTNRWPQQIMPVCRRWKQKSAGCVWKTSS
jgi:transposase-like protein